MGKNRRFLVSSDARTLCLEPHMSLWSVTTHVGTCAQDGTAEDGTQKCELYVHTCTYRRCVRPRSRCICSRSQPQSDRSRPSTCRNACIAEDAVVVEQEDSRGQPIAPRQRAHGAGSIQQLCWAGCAGQDVEAMHKLCRSSMSPQRSAVRFWRQAGGASHHGTVSTRCEQRHQAALRLNPAARRTCSSDIAATTCMREDRFVEAVFPAQP